MRNRRHSRSTTAKVPAMSTGGRNGLNDREFRFVGALAARSAAEFVMAGDADRRAGLAVIAIDQACERYDTPRRMACHVADDRRLAVRGPEGQFECSGVES